MKRTWLYIIGCVLAVAAAAGAFLAMGHYSDHSKTNDTNSIQTVSPKTTPSSKEACGIFTLAEAKQVLGSDVKGGSNGSPTSSDDLTVSTCTYTQDSGAGGAVSSSKAATLLVRAPKTAAGTASNKNQFGPLRPANVQEVSGYGDSAYWDPQYGQLDILKSDTWYILSSGPVTPSERTLGQGKALADILIDKM